MLSSINKYTAMLIAICLFLLLLIDKSAAQSRMVMNNNVYMVIENSAILTIANSSSNALITTGAGGNIVSEDENDKVKWMTGNAVGTYVIPYSTSAGIKIPFSLAITSPGDAGGYLLFSTYNGPTWDNSTYMPTDVTHMNGLYTATNNSANTIDRFWIADPNSYTSKPGVILNFTYVSAEHTAAGNTIFENDLAAQRFNSGALTWGDFDATGTVNTMLNTVSNVVVNPSDFFRSWTLSQTGLPLPVELVSLLVECDDKGGTLHWTTASETNNDYFLLEKSVDGNEYFFCKNISGQGTTNFTTHYREPLADVHHYYRLTQVDMDGTQEILGVVFNSCVVENINLWQPVNDPGLLILNGLTNGDLELNVFDMNGKLVWTDKREVAEGKQMIRINEAASGIYLVQARNNQKTTSLKIVL